MAPLATKLSRYRLSPSGWSLGLKAGVILTLCLCLSFSSFIYFFATEQNKLAAMAHHQNLTISQLLAEEISGAVRWRKPDVIGQVVARFQAQQEGNLEQVVVWDRHDKLLYGQAEGVLDQPKAAFLAHSLPHSDSEQTAVSGSLMVVALPIRSGALGDIIGHMEARWSLERVQGLVRESVWQDIWIAVGEFLILIVGFLLLLRWQVTGPIQVMTSCMSRLAKGDLEIDVPNFDRRDEISAMARALRVFRANAIKIKQVTDELKAQAERLNEALTAEKELNALQRQFVSMVSHEFRTPLTIIDAGAQRILRRGDRITSDRVQEILGKIRTSVRRLTELMESVLSSARLEAGTINFEPAPCSLKNMLLEIVVSYRELYPSRKIIVDIDHLPDVVLVDEKLMRQVIANLLSNAIKYSPDGASVWINGQLTGDEGICISVRDEGVGIPSSEVNRLFERFFRASTSTGIAGTGIGLNMVKALVDMHDGRVEVESEEGKGTTFVIHLPASNNKSAGPVKGEMLTAS